MQSESQSADSHLNHTTNYALSASGWQATGGTGTTSGGQATYYGYQGTGKYNAYSGINPGGNPVNGSIQGTFSQSQSNTVSFGYHTNDSYTPATSTSPGGWSATGGTGAATDSGSSSFSYQGNGKYRSPEGDVNGTMNQSGGANESFGYTTNYFLNASGNWAVGGAYGSGSGGASGSGWTNSSYNGGRDANQEIGGYAFYGTDDQSGSNNTSYQFQTYAAYNGLDWSEVGNMTSSGNGSASDSFSPDEEDDSIVINGPQSAGPYTGFANAAVPFTGTATSSTAYSETEHQFLDDTGMWQAASGDGSFTASGSQTWSYDGSESFMKSAAAETNGTITAHGSGLFSYNDTQYYAFQPGSQGGVWVATSATATTVQNYNYHYLVNFEYGGGSLITMPGYHIITGYIQEDVTSSATIASTTAASNGAVSTTLSGNGSGYELLSSTIDGLIIAGTVRNDSWSPNSNGTFPTYQSAGNRHDFSQSGGVWTDLNFAGYGASVDPLSQVPQFGVHEGPSTLTPCIESGDYALTGMTPDPLYTALPVIPAMPGAPGTIAAAPLTSSESLPAIARAVWAMGFTPESAPKTDFALRAAFWGAEVRTAQQLIATDLVFGEAANGPAFPVNDTSTIVDYGTKTVAAQTNTPTVNGSAHDPLLPIIGSAMNYYAFMDVNSPATSMFPLISPRPYEFDNSLLSGGLPLIEHSFANLLLSPDDFAEPYIRRWTSSHRFDEAKAFKDAAGNLVWRGEVIELPDGQRLALIVVRQSDGQTVTKVTHLANNPTPGRAPVALQYIFHDPFAAANFSARQLRALELASYGADIEDVIEALKESMNKMGPLESLQSAAARNNAILKQIDSLQESLDALKTEFTLEGLDTVTVLLYHNFETGWDKGGTGWTTLTDLAHDYKFLKGAKFGGGPKMESVFVDDFTNIWFAIEGAWAIRKLAKGLVGLVGDAAKAGREFLARELATVAEEIIATEAPEALALRTLRILGDTCFAAGTPILTPNGEKAIEDFVPGDEIVSRPDDAPELPARPSVVEKLFKLSAPTLVLRVGGHAVTTTAKHPFYAQGKGWVPAQQLQPGDLILGLDGCATPIESIVATGRTETVYNLRVALDHTYFVGRALWGFSLWVHNAYVARPIIGAVDGAWEVVEEVGPGIERIVNPRLSKNAAEKLATFANRGATLRDAIARANAATAKGIKNPGVKWGTDIAEQGIPWEDYLETFRPGTRLPKGFKTFDFWDPATGLATSAKTLNTLTESRLLTPRYVYDVLRGYINETLDFPVDTVRGVTLRASQITARELVVAVPEGTSLAEWAEIERAIHYGQENGVTVLITVIK